MTARRVLLAALLCSLVTGCGGHPRTIHEAAKRGDLDGVKRFLDQAPSLLNERDNEGLTPLDWAILDGRIEVVRYLVERGSEINPKTAQDWAPILSCASRYDEASDQAMRLLLDSGADVNFRYEPEGSTALGMAANNGMETKVEMLLEAGARPSPLDGNGNTPLDSTMRSLSFATGTPPDEVGSRWPDTPEHRQHIAALEHIIELLRSHGGLTAKQLEGGSGNGDEDSRDR